MSANKKIYTSLKNITLFSQLALSVLTPVILAIWFCSWLKTKYNLGDWVVIVGIVVGLASGFTSLTQYFKQAIRQAEKEQEEYNNQFKD